MGFNNSLLQETAKPVFGEFCSQFFCCCWFEIVVRQWVNLFRIAEKEKIVVGGDGVGDKGSFSVQIIKKIIVIGYQGYQVQTKAYETDSSRLYFGLS